MKATVDIPTDLSAEEALCITTLLEKIINAIWVQYHDEMIERLDRHRRHARADPRCPVCQPTTDDDLPF